MQACLELWRDPFLLETPVPEELQLYIYILPSLVQCHAVCMLIVKAEQQQVTADSSWQ